jgi:hypothetical protein
VIFGQKGGHSPTSKSEALSIHRWSLTLLEGQMVSPQSSGFSQQLDLVVGGELLSLLLSEIGKNSWSSLMFGGRGTLVLVCFFSFLF